MERLSEGQVSRILDSLNGYEVLMALQNRNLHKTYPVSRPKRTSLDTMSGVSIGSAKKRRYSSKHKIKY